MQKNKAESRVKTKIKAKPSKTKTKKTKFEEGRKKGSKETTKPLTWVPVERKSGATTSNQINNESLKRKVRKSNAETNKLIGEADSVLRAIDTINANYRESKSVIKVKLNSNSHEYSDAQVLEKAQINHFAERISRSLEGLKQIETEIDKTTKFSREIAEEAEKSWYIRWFRVIY